ncbi:AraC family transcriptional regulator [Ahrensia marina]|uniref:helix-turn-helix domain-containing protein n=1 Tax=Ahrensia marina TaxID=1514904 RepID=UPI0035D0AABE
MITIPIVWLVSVLAGLAAGILGFNVRLPLSTRAYLCGFLVMIGIVGLLLGLRLSYGVNWAGLFQPHVALMIAPLAYLGFSSLTHDTVKAEDAALVRNGALVLAAQLAMLFPLPLSADIILLIVTSVYLVKLTRLSRLDAEAFAILAPAYVSRLRIGIFATSVLLALMIAGDFAIVATMIFATETLFVQFLNGAAGVLSAFVIIVALVGIPLLINRPTPHRPGDTAAKLEPSDDDRQLFQSLCTLLEDKRLYTDSDLSLARVARRLGVSARDVSNAVNRCTSENFSRMINGFRIRNAQAMLRDTDLPVTEIMLSSGFVSKSNFNTEFRRVSGQTPSQFRNACQSSQGI